MLETENYGSLVILRATKPVTLPNAVTLLQELEGVQVNQEISTIIFDLSDVDKADGSGLGMVVNIATKARAAGQKMYLYRPSPVVRQTLKELEIDGFFPLFEYEEELLALMPD